MKRFSNTSKKAVVVLCVLSFGFAAPSLSVAYAWSIPGVTEPFDPPNYYSPTSISWPDSAPSPFALEDLAAQGGLVYDYTRHIKSILYGTKFVAWLEKLLAKLGIEETNAKHLSDEQKQQSMGDIQGLQASVQKNQEKIDLNPPAFDRKYDDGIPGKKLDYREVSKFLSDTFATATQHTVNRYRDMDNIMQTLQTALQNSNHAVGETQVLQSGAVIEAVKQAAIADLSTAISDQIQIRNVRHMQEAADVQQQADQQLNGTYHIFNPGDPDDLVMLQSYEADTGYQSYKSKPMPDF